MQNNLVFFYLVRRNKMAGPSRTFRHATKASGVTDTARKVQATKGRNAFEKARQAEYEASQPCSQAPKQAPPVVKQTAEVYKEVVEHSFPQKEMVNLVAGKVSLPPGEEFLCQALREYPAMTWYLRQGLSLNPLLLPMETPLKQQVADLWEKILQHLDDARSTGRPIGTFFGPNQWSLWQATEFALRRKITAKEWEAMVDADLVEGYLDLDTEEQEEHAEEEFLPQEVEATC